MCQKRHGDAAILLYLHRLPIIVTKNQLTMNRYIVLFLLSLLSVISYAQSTNTPPNCRDINTPLDVNGNASITLLDFLTNGPQVAATVTITAGAGHVIWGPTAVFPIHRLSSMPVLIAIKL